MAERQPRQQPGKSETRKKVSKSPSSASGRSTGRVASKSNDDDIMQWLDESPSTPDGRANDTEDSTILGEASQPEPDVSDDTVADSGPIESSTRVEASSRRVESPMVEPSGIEGGDFAGRDVATSDIESPTEPQEGEPQEAEAAEPLGDRPSAIESSSDAARRMLKKRRRKPSRDRKHTATPVSMAAPPPEAAPSLMSHLATVARRPISIAIILVLLLSGVGAYFNLNRPPRVVVDHTAVQAWKEIDEIVGEMNRLRAEKDAKAWDALKQRLKVELVNMSARLKKGQTPLSPARSLMVLNLEANLPSMLAHSFKGETAADKAFLLNHLRAGEKLNISGVVAPPVPEAKEESEEDTEEKAPAAPAPRVERD